MDEHDYFQQKSGVAKKILEKEVSQWFQDYVEKY